MVSLCRDEPDGKLLYRIGPRFAPRFPQLNASTLELRRGRRTVKLEHIPAQVLLILIEEQGKVIARQAIADRIWGKDAFVDVERIPFTAISVLAGRLQEPLRRFDRRSSSP